eukprot:CAMPEP_0119004464 /NCGR_PEP_ID=MMETSP1176-20130426/1153_1 /TAXON_ID=265551 /ORGANISM="Synedropsis recta cf, Strain CCMP1620" /LENGTH=36 /DNA_ID= /DNA_START= /DNA_END= /DNA_ORIENTATION=
MKSAATIVDLIWDTSFLPPKLTPISVTELTASALIF